MFLFQIQIIVLIIVSLFWCLCSIYFSLLLLILYFMHENQLNYAFKLCFAQWSGKFVISGVRLLRVAYANSLQAHAGQGRIYFLIYFTYFLLFHMMNNALGIYSNYFNDE